MNSIHITTKLSTQKKWIKYLEKLRWKNKPTCPYCIQIKPMNSIHITTKLSTQKKGIIYKKTQNNKNS